MFEVMCQYLSGRDLQATPSGVIIYTQPDWRAMTFGSSITGAALPRAKKRHRARMGLEVCMVVLCSRARIRAWLLISYRGI